MPYKIEQENILYLEGTHCICSKDLEHIATIAQTSPQRSARLCVHPDVNSELHEMYVVHLKGKYLRPHRHLDRDKSCILLKGSMAVLFFDDDGTVSHVYTCGGRETGAVFHIRVPAGRWYCQVVFSEHVLFSEVTTGPFIKSHTEYADFSPEEHSAEAAAYARVLWKVATGGK